MNREVVLAEWQQVTKRLTVLIASFTPEAFNQKASETTWSAAQIADHLLKVDISTYKALQSETIPTNRPPDQKLALIKEAMESDTKRVAPERVLPSGNWSDPREVIQQMQRQRELSEMLIRNSDLTEACKDYKHPALGTLTRLEWIYFNIGHAERHIIQMQRLQNRSVEV